MTCQWCIHFRYKGVAVCTWPGRNDGKIIPAKERIECSGFEPRRICSTCEHRCDYPERESSGGSYGECDRWKLRSLSTWGGVRKRTRKRKESLAVSGKPESSTNNKQGENQS